MDQPTEAQRAKQNIRTEASARRRRQENLQHVSLQVFERLARMPEYRDAQTLLCYISFRSEVCTRQFVARAISDEKRVAIPYCVHDRLKLFRLHSFDDLEPGTIGILEPRTELRARPHRHVAIEELDLVVAPGLAFDPACGRVGYGKGYYDRLLRSVRPGTAVIGVAFQCQVFPAVPILPSDVRVDKVVTETAVYRRSLPRWNGNAK